MVFRPPQRATSGWETFGRACGRVIPKSYKSDGEKKYRLDIWFHGRGETLSEAGFIHQRYTQAGRYAPKDTIVLHPYGRYSNAFKFAGEVDVLEALDDVRRRYRIDDDRISVRGFSMGGAACWQFAVHYSDRWFASNPGAGFSETPEFLKFFQKETLNPTWYEKKLWHMYDCTGYALNLFHCPTVAYSGELDIQKQAADIMEAALADEGIDMLHIIGPQTKHAIHRDSAKIIERLMDDLAEVGRQHTPRTVHLVTYTLKYNRMNWVTVNAMGEHCYSSKNHGLILIYPNPLNPKRYVVLNSGFTYREYAYLNNARQVPMLPDWAVIDLRTPPGSQYPGKVVDADFFGERWELRPPRGK